VDADIELLLLFDVWPIAAGLNKADRCFRYTEAVCQIFLGNCASQGSDFLHLDFSELGSAMPFSRCRVSIFSPLGNVFAVGKPAQVFYTIVITDGI